MSKRYDMKYIARYSEHIDQDIQRNWSSWNFGQEGFEGTEDELETAKDQAIENERSFYISGFDLWGDDIRTADIRELYTGYWVLVDNTNGFGDGIFGTALDSEDLEAAIAEARTANFSGEGVRFDSADWELITSINNEIHIFQQK